MKPCRSGLAPDGGLYLPESYPQLDFATLNSWRTLLADEGYAALAAEVLVRTLGQGVVRVKGKGSKDRLVPLGEESQHWLQRYLDGARAQLAGKRGAATPRRRMRAAK